MSIRFQDPGKARQTRLQKRLRFFYIALCLGYFVILVRGVTLMLQDNKKLETIAMRQYRAAIQMASDRSRILDSKGQEFAISVPAYSLYSDPRDVENPSATAQSLSNILGISKKNLEDKLREKRKFVWLERRLDSEKMEKIKKQNLHGIYSIKENMRFYPHGKLGGNVLGVVGVDSKGLAGVELAYNSYLTITHDSGIYLRDARGQIYVTPNAEEKTTEAGDVYLTLDKNLQFFAEKELAAAVEKSGAKAGIVLMMDPKTGEILIMANSPSLDPNQFDRADFNAWRNRTVTDIYEPGSTFKVITAAAALESGVLSPREKFYCERGALQLANGHVINDHSPHEWLDLSEIIKVSSNIGIYKVSQKLGKEKFYATIRNFGFGSKTGIDFPGEVSGLLRSVQRWQPIETGTISFGQGIGVTSLQLLSAFGAIANKGVRMQPHLVEKIVGKNGELLYQVSHSSINQSIRPETAIQLTRMLQKVVEPGGTAPAAFIEEYPVAGKTGTAQKVDSKTGRYFEGKYVASFIGFAPAEDPRLVMLVWLDEPQGAYFGGTVAAPVFKNIMQKALHYMGVPPKGSSQEMIVVKKDFPSSEAVLVQEGDQFKVPDFHGVSLRQALKATGYFPVKMELKGRGRAILQSPEPGAYVSAGSKIYVEFAPLY